MKPIELLCVFEKKNPESNVHQRMTERTTATHDPTGTTLYTATGTYDPGTPHTIPTVAARPADLGRTFNAVIVALTVILSVGAVSLNLGVMYFYWRKMRRLIPFLYFTLGTSDLITGICAGIHSAIFTCILALENSDFSSIFYPVIISYFFTVVTFKVSAFVSMIFSVIRTINIVSPFIPVRKEAPIVSMTVWLVIWVTVSALEVGTIFRTVLAVREDTRAVGVVR